jgi:tetraacyldisaccharide 4'-kinase
MVAKKLESYLKEIIRGKRSGLFAWLIKCFLLPMSWCYCLGVKVRNWFYDQGWMRRYVPPISLVISVGNIVAGGTGKTPVTLMIAQFFYQRYPIAILSRGYRSKAEKTDRSVLLCDGEGPQYPASYCGDEPYLFAKRLPKAIVVVGGNRKKGAILAAKEGAQVLILDDGLQHRHLVRDLDVVVIDIGDPFGEGYFLPRGFLRDEISSLARAQLIVLNHLRDPEKLNGMKELLKPFTSAPIVGMKGVVKSIRDFKGDEVTIPLDERDVGAFCAIAHPEYFRRTLEQEGFTLVSEYILPDHMEITEKELAQFVQTSLKKKAKWIICTEKDRVKLGDVLTIGLPLIWVEMEQQVVTGLEEWNAFLKEAEMKIH